jgi:hypothetical protein
VTYPEEVEKVDAVIDEPEDTSDPLESMMRWANKHGLGLILCELVLHAKTAEANQLHNKGPRVEMEYLLKVYEGDTVGLRDELVRIGQYLKRYHMPPTSGKVTDAAEL